MVNNSNDKKEKKENESQSWGFALGEICFILLPFVVMLIILLYQGKITEIFNKPEWSFASSVMFGQTIIKLIHSIGKKRENYVVYQYNAGAFIAAIIVLGLVPSLILLALLFTTLIVPLWIIISQLVIFVLALILFTTINLMIIKEEEED